MNIDALLLAIAMVESANNPMAIGAHGERGRYQLSHILWIQHSQAPFKQAHTPMADVVAKKHIAWLSKHAVRNMQHDPFWIAMCWKHGLQQATKYRLNPSTVPAVSWDYANRVSNLYEDFDRELRNKNRNDKHTTS